jgi:hypothetical protein
MMHRKRLLFLVALLFLTISAFAGMPARYHHFAQVGDGELYGIEMRTSFLVLNQNRLSSVQITLNFYDDNGNPLSLTVDGSTGSSYITFIPPGGMKKLTTPGQGPGLKVGWATLTATREVGAQVFFQMYKDGNLVTQAAIEPVGSLKSMDLFVDFDVMEGLETGDRTGYAIVNLSQVSSAEVSIVLMDQNGDPWWSALLTIPALGHVQGYFDELFPFVKPPLTQWRGFARIVASGGPISVSALQSKGLIIGSLAPLRRPFYSRFGGE